MKKIFRISTLLILATVMVLFPSCNNELKRLDSGSVNEYIYPYVKFTPTEDGSACTAVVVSGAKLTTVKIPATNDGVPVVEFKGFENVEDAENVKKIVLGSSKVVVTPETLKQVTNIQNITIEDGNYMDKWGKLPDLEKDGFEFLGWFAGDELIIEGLPVDPNHPYAKPKWRAHRYVQHVGKDATCTEPGYKPYKTCEDCNYTDFEAIPALGHDLKYINRIEPSCTESGNIAYYECSRCNLKWTDADSSSPVYDVVLKAKGHELTHFNESPATCNKEGMKERWYCSVCQKFFLDESCEFELSPSELIIPKLKHDFSGEWVNTDKRGHYHICSLCGQFSEIQDHEWDEGVILKEPNPEEHGEKLFTCTVCGFTRTEEIVDDEHVWGAPVVVPPTCTEEGYTIYSCTHCDKTWKTDYVKPTGHDTVFVEEVPATCQKTGLKAHWHCNNSCGLDYEDKDASIVLKDLTLPLLDHIWKITYDKANPEKGHWYVCTVGGESKPIESHKYTIKDLSHKKADATCTEPAKYWLSCECGYCPEDDAYIFEEGKPVGHKTDKNHHFPKKDKTCLVDGHIEYWVCTNCGKYFKNQALSIEVSPEDVIIPAVGHHTYSPTSYVDFGEDGHKHQCTECFEFGPLENHDSLSWIRESVEHPGMHARACSKCSHQVGPFEPHVWEIAPDGTYICSICRYTSPKKIEGEGGFGAEIVIPVYPKGHLKSEYLSNKSWKITFVSDNDLIPESYIWQVNGKIIESSVESSFILNAEHAYSYEILCILKHKNGNGSAFLSVIGGR